MNDKGKVLAKGCPDGGMDTSKKLRSSGDKREGSEGGMSYSFMTNPTFFLPSILMQSGRGNLT